MELDLRGKVGLVTGANRGIGAAVAAELAREGMHLCLVARDSDKLREVADRLMSSANINAQIISADLRDPAAPQRAIAEAVAHHRRLDVLVNNAGATKRADFFTLTEEDWQDGFALKFHGYVRMTRAAWPHLRQSKGSIVNIVGIGARAGSAEFTIGGSVNVALLNFTKAMPSTGLIETDRFTRNIERIMRERSLGRDGAITFLVSSHGTTRVGKPAEIGALAAYLASSKADFIQGSLIDIDGGATRSL
jgi:3-oxoacyl-[acyl-carrier protein] reductase